MQDAAHITMILDIALSACLVALRLEKSFKKFYGRHQDLIEKYLNNKLNDLILNLIPEIMTQHSRSVKEMAR